jgi:uncharacterized membrane protein YphA (DoxX/SURF4 family)
MMNADTVQNRMRTRARVSLVAIIIIGVTLVAAGIGKAIGFGEIPGQTVEFLGDILPEAFITPATVFLIYEIFIPYVLPGTEIILGIFLLIGFVPRLISVLCLPMTLAFMSNNIWSISQGLDKFPECVCFGVWEKLFGGLTPVQALCYDIGLFVLAVVIIWLYPGGFLSSRKWVTKFLTGKSRAG